MLEFLYYYYLIQFFYSIIIPIIIILVIWGIVRKVRSESRAALNAWTVPQVFNAPLEELLQQIAMAVQMQQIEQIRALQQSMQHRVASLPRPERMVYQGKLSDVVSGRKKLNTETGEWENG
jgi:hypothetical protein